MNPSKPILTPLQELNKLEFENDYAYRLALRNPDVKAAIAKVLGTKYEQNKKRITELRTEIAEAKNKKAAAVTDLKEYQWDKAAKAAAKAFSGVDYGGEMVLLAQNNELQQFLFKKLPSTAYLDRGSGSVHSPVQYFCIDGELAKKGFFGWKNRAILLEHEGRIKKESLKKLMDWAHGKCPLPEKASL